MVTALCVLDQGLAVYLTEEEPSRYVQATYRWDRQTPLTLGIYDQPDKAFYILFIHLLGHLTRSVLGIHGLNRFYGTFEATNSLIACQGARFNQA